MISSNAFNNAMVSLKACLPTREGNILEWSKLTEQYDQALGRAKIEEIDFLQAVERIILEDHWFPTAARIIGMCDECARTRREQGRSVQALPSPVGRVPLVCPYCHGGRWVRLGGASPLKSKPGANEFDRIVACAHCTTDHRHDPAKERATISRDGGVPDPNGEYVPDMTKSDWRLPRTIDGRPDLEALYRESRVLRGLDPDVDERPNAPAGWKTLGKVFA
jgi:hypothetical protein